MTVIDWTYNIGTHVGVQYLTKTYITMNLSESIGHSTNMNTISYHTNNNFKYKAFKLLLFFLTKRKRNKIDNTCIQPDQFLWIFYGDSYSNLDKIKWKFLDDGRCNSLALSNVADISSFSKYFKSFEDKNIPKTSKIKIF